MNRFKIIIDLNNGVAVLTEVSPNNRAKQLLAEIWFLKDVDQFTVTDVNVNHEYKHSGYGTMLMYALMGVAKSEGRPIVLFSSVHALPFYLKCGFLPIRKFANGKYRGKRLRVVNSNPKKTFRSQVGKGDLVWFPLNVNMAFVYL